MNFFADVEPRVDWKNSRVFVKSLELPVCKYGTKDCKCIADVVVKTRPSATSRANTFAELSVEETLIENENELSSVEAVIENELSSVEAVVENEKEKA
jgi:hypothetical protein